MCIIFTIKCLKYPYISVSIDANNCLTYDFFVGSATEFLSGPIYDLNQIGQVVAGTYIHVHMNILILL